MKQRKNLRFEKSLFLFRRDLRLIDNTALLAACASSKRVITGFIFDPRQIQKHPYRSENALQFMLQSLEELNAALLRIGGRLHCWQGRAEEVVYDILKAHNFEALFFNKDYTPFALRRDKAIAEKCRKLERECCSFDDALLQSPESILKADGKPYTVFSAYHRAALKLEVARPRKAKSMYSLRLEPPVANCWEKTDILPKFNENLLLKGGRSEGLKLLQETAKLTNYKEDRNFPARDCHTKLSAHHKFGTLSIREVYHFIKDKVASPHDLLKELFWRDFFCTIGYYFPHVFRGSFRPAYDKVRWNNDLLQFRSWCSGKTGFPIVDAGMRELNVSGFMHNRLRMITASFLVKDLLIDWRWGEKYFAEKLLDYDPAVNNGNWQWVASSGCDAQPYFRIFNPWLQQKKYDPDCLYIKRWVPELRRLSPGMIHSLVSGNGVEGYPSPIVRHEIASKIAERKLSKSA